jgi:hypothetical protein
LQNFRADPLVIVGESMKLFMGCFFEEDVEGITENCLCITGGEHTVVKKSLTHFLGMIVFVS